MRNSESFQPVSLVIDRTTFDRLVLEHLPAAQRFAIRLTGDPDTAEDLVQDALLKAHRSWQTFRGESRFQTWLFQIIVNCFRDRLRTQIAATPRVNESHADPAAGRPELQLQSDELGELVAREVSTLPPRQREVLVLIVYEDLSIRETATLLGLSEQNVRTNLHFARERLKERLKLHLSV